MSEDFGSLAVMILHQLGSSLVAAQGYGEMLEAKSNAAALVPLQLSLSRAKVLLQSLESYRYLTSERQLSLQPVQLDALLKKQLRELKSLLDEHHVEIICTRVYQLPSIAADPDYVSELLKLVFYFFLLLPNPKISVTIQLVVKKDVILLQLSSPALSFEDQSLILKKTKTNSPNHLNPHSATEAIILLLTLLGKKSNIQFSFLRGKLTLAFQRSSQLALEINHD